jgi:sugar-specific transcriptional regulator TrmB
MNKIEFFQEIGFSEYEAKTLVSLIKLGKANPKEINLDSQVPQNKLYSIIKKFINLGILAIIPTEPKKYQLINIKTFIQERIKEKEEQTRKLKENSRQIENLEEKEEQAVFSLIKGQKAIMNRLAEENSKVEKEILGVQRNWKFWGEGIRAMQSAIKRGVDVKLIGEVDEKNIEIVNEWKKIGCKIRKYNKKFGEYPLRFSIFDNKTARITIGKPEISNPEDYITIWTDSKPLIAMLRKQFLDMWKECEKF